MIKFDWNLLHQFKEIVDSQTIDTAISQHGISRATISRIFIKLEELVGGQIVERHTKGNIQLTNLGKLILHKTNSINEGVEELFKKSLNAKKPLFIGCTQGISTLELSEKMSALKNSLGNAVIHIKTHYPELSDAIASNDIVIYPNVKHGTNIIKRKIKDYEFGLFASKKYLEKHGNITSTADLLRHKIIGYSAQKDFLFSGSNEFILDLISPHVDDDQKEKLFSVYVNSTMSEFAFCSEGLGIACVQTNSAIGKKLELVRVLPQYSYKSGIYMYYKSDDFHTPTEQIFEVLSS